MEEPMDKLKTDYNSNGQLYQLEQSEYLMKVGDHRWLNYSFIYIPDKCQKETCKLHIMWHGCGATSGTYGTQWLRLYGMIEHASASEFIAIFPQVWDEENVSEAIPYNHCWRSVFQEDSQHPQILALRSVLKGVFGRELLHDDYASSGNFERKDDMTTSGASILQLV